MSTPEKDLSGEGDVLRDAQSGSCFTTTGPHGLLPCAECDDTSTRPITDTQNSRNGPEYASLQGVQHPTKRRGSSGGEKRPAKRQILPPTTPSPSPFQTLRVTKLDVVTRDTVSKRYGVDNCIENLAVGNGSTAAPQSLHRTTMDYLTPDPTCHSDGHGALHSAGGVLSYSMPQLQIFEEGAGGLEPLTAKQLDSHTDSLCQPGPGEYPTSVTLEGSEISATAWADEADEYPLDEFLEEEMLRVAEEADAKVVEGQIPPSSVVRHLDRNSRSVSDYDPNLQHSSQSNSPDQENSPEPRLPRCEDSTISNDLLDEDVDWNAVLKMVKDSPKDPSLLGSREAACPSSTYAPAGITSGEPSQSTLANEDKHLGSFARPLLPNKAQNGWPIPELSSQSALRTCFCLGDLITQATHCHQNQQDAIFDLYARVTYSSRESMAKQHFQFIDLFRDMQPCITGILTEWRAGSLLDQQSHGFIAATKPKLCRCICKVHRDMRASVGWKMEVKDIREVTWNDIRHAKLTICAEEV